MKSSSSERQIASNRPNGPDGSTKKQLPQMDGRELKKIREAAGWTQGQLGDKLGVDRRTIRKWENKERDMPGPAVILARQIRDSLK
jgi:DNA-binding transcriptional regulator YiaG